MSLFFLDDSTDFPPVEAAEPDGLLAIGGDLSTERLLQAYRSGIFPWYSEGPILWWSPDPRFVLFPAELRIHKSMRPYLNQPKYDYRYNTAFRRVIESCGKVPRRDQPGTWIQPELIEAYTRLHELGFVISAEAWEQGELVGGLYGLRLGHFFFGESMFSLKPNASKFAFIKLVQQLATEGIELIDCQVYTEHLESLGARMIPRAEFIQLLNRGLSS